MAGSAYIPGIAIQGFAESEARRHSAVVRITHWLNAISFIGLLVSGIGILLAHPRFYWGETGGIGMPSLFDLPLPFMLGGPSGWGRYLHFESAWLCVLNGLIYLATGFASRHFSRDLVPSSGDFNAASVRGAFATPTDAEALNYNLLQRVTYLGVVFVFFPLMIWTGLAMSPAVTSVFPFFVDVLGGHQTARTLHFFAAILLVLFVFVHVAMVWRAGFVKRVAAMITGDLKPEV